MNLQQKALAIIIPLILLLSAVYSYYLYQVKSKQIEQVTEIAEEQLHQQYKHLIDTMLRRHYRYTLLQMLANPELTSAVERNDRNKIMELVLPLWSILREENPKLSRLHFHRADGVSLLRAHRPDMHGDAIAEVRPALQQLHRQQRPFDTIEMGRHGLFFRILQPIFSPQGIYLGGVEMGISIDYLLQELSHIAATESVVMIDKAALSVLRTPFSPSFTLGDYTLWSEQEVRPGWLKYLPGDLAQGVHSLIKSDDGRTYQLHVFGLPSLEGSPQGLVVLMHDLSHYFDERDTFFQANIAITIALVVGAFLTLRLTLTPLLQQSQESNRQLEETVKKVTRLSVTDPLTGIFNRQKFNQSLQQEVNKAARYKLPLSLIMFDLDHFKQVNDRFGHPAGDVVLQECTEVINSNIRSSDLFARWGGEEFILILPHQTLASAALTAEKLRAAVDEHSFETIGHLTISCGVTQLISKEGSESLLQRLDENLYRAKAEGRNRVVAG